jgi:hypothetical protein
MKKIKSGNRLIDLAGKQFARLKVLLFYTCRTDPVYSGGGRPCFGASVKAGASLYLWRYYD